MKVNFKKCKLLELEEFMNTYIKLLSSPIDSYLEEHILNAEHFYITYNEKRIGYFSIYNKELLTQFYLDMKYRCLGQEVFFKVMRMQNLQSAYVPTCDEFFLSHALDSYKSIEKQAYFFKDSRKSIDKRGNIIDVRLAQYDDIDGIIRNSGKFFDKFDERILREEIYIASKNSIVVGYGIMEKGIIMKEYVSIGMYTIEKYRQKGIGRAILLELKEQVYQKNKLPIAGCWYYNHNSKKTLESAGMYSSTRLLRVFY